MTHRFISIKTIAVSFSFFVAPTFALAATLSLSPSTGSFTVGNVITVQIQVNTQGSASDGVDVRYLNFNPSLLQAIDENALLSGVQITAGSLMLNTPTNNVDNVAGRVTFSQVPTGGTTFANSASQTLATVRFTVVGSGTAAVTFSHTPGSTSDSNVASGGSDLLTAVTNGSYTLAAANIPPVVSPISTNVSDVDPVTPGIQYYEGTTVTYSGSASDADGDVLTWTWLYTINGGPEIQFSTGTGAVQNAVFTYGAGTAGSTYRWILRVTDGRSSPVQSTLDVMIVTPPDITAPVISNIVSSNITTSGATITWTTDESADSQVEYGLTTSYGTLSPLDINRVISHTVLLSGLSPSTTYNYRVRSRDAAGNLGVSLNRTFRTQDLPDTTPPAAIVGASVSSITTTSAMLSWSAPADLPGGGAAASYDIRYSTTLITELNFGSATIVTGEPTPATPGTTQTYIIAGLTSSTAYYAVIKSQDAVGNISLISNVVSFTTQAPADTTPPSVPNGVTATAISTSQIDLIWNASIDNVGVTLYRVERCQGTACTNFTEVATPSITNYPDMGLIANTTYRYRVRAEDAALNLSGYSSIASAATTDTIAPNVSITAPLNNDTVAGIIPVTASATDNIGVLGVQFLLDGANLDAEDTIAPYGISWNTTTVLDGSHILTARARDAASNITISSGITVNVLNNPPPPFDFSLSNEGNKGVAQSSSVSNTIDVALVSGTAQSVVFSVSDLPAGAIGTFLPTSCNPGCSTILTISVLSTTPVGSYLITITGIGNGTTHTTQFTLSVTPPPSNKFKKSDRIKVTGSEVRSGGGLSYSLLGTQPVGTLGTITDGPVFSDNLFWWQIDYDSSGGIGDATLDGWTREDHLELAVFATGTKLVPYVEGNIVAPRSFTVNILQSAAPTTLFTFTSTPDAQQEIPVTISTLLEGTYDLLIHSPSFLRKKMDDVVINSNITITLPILLGGDFNNDGIINEIDWSFMNPRWFSADLDADLNRDGVVNSIDFSYMNKNWYAIGD